MSIDQNKLEKIEKDDIMFEENGTITLEEFESGDEYDKHYYYDKQTGTDIRKNS